MSDRYATLRHGLVGAWCPSIGGVGTVLRDFARTNNLANAAGYAAQFGPTSVYVQGSSNSAVATNDDVQRVLNGATAATLTGWVRRITASNYVAFGFTGNSVSGNRFSTIWFGDGVWYVSVESGGSGSVGSVAYAPSPELATHCAITFNGSAAAASRVTLFINGVARTLSLTGTTPAALSSSLGTFALGRDNSNRLSASFGAGGWIDDVRIYNRVLTLAEIRLLASQRGIGLVPTRHRRARLSTAAATTLWLRVGGTWKATTPKINIGGTWKTATPKINVSGVWKG